MNGKGFSLIELMVTIALLAIVLALAIPSFREMIQRNQLTTQANSLVTALNVARSEAVKRGSNVSLGSCATASSDCSAVGGAWANGWVVWQDADEDGDMAAAEVIRVFPSVPASLTLALSVVTPAAGSGAGASRLVFYASGRAGGEFCFDLAVKDAGANAAIWRRAVSVLVSGAISTKEGVSCT